VVGAAGIEVSDGTVVIGDRTFRSGDVITIDGSTGEVFDGAIAGSTEVVPEAAILLGWARELGIPIPDSGPAGQPADAPATTGSGATRAITPDDCLRAIAMKGLAPAQGIADAVISTPDEVQPVLDQLVADGLATTTAGAYRPTEDGTSRAADLRAAEQAAWGIDSAAAALDAFVALDNRMKETVTAWQLRDDAEGQVVNDHADAAYDGRVLDRLAAIHADTVTWLTPLEAGFQRLAAYRERLGRANDQAQAGDQRYVASPRVDSYHGIWFELHEDLIQLAGRTREDEVTAGRA
jgi:pyruvate, orthophosphate dikinase